MHRFIKFIKQFGNILIASNSKLLLLFFFKNNIWELKSSLQHNYTRFKEILYFSYLERFGSWIGINSYFETPPILPHGLYGIFISENAKIGKNVVIFQQVTIGSNNLPDSSHNGSPSIGDNCFIGCGAKIIGKVRVGSSCRVGANCIVVKDVPDNSVCVLKNTKIIVRDKPMDNRHMSVFAIKD